MQQIQVTGNTLRELANSAKAQSPGSKSLILGTLEDGILNIEEQYPHTDSKSTFTALINQLSGAFQGRANGYLEFEEESVKINMVGGKDNQQCHITLSYATLDKYVLR